MLQPQQSSFSFRHFQHLGKSGCLWGQGGGGWQAAVRGCSFPPLHSAVNLSPAEPMCLPSCVGRMMIFIATWCLSTHTVCGVVSAQVVSSTCSTVFGEIWYSFWQSQGRGPHASSSHISDPALFTFAVESLNVCRRVYDGGGLCVSPHNAVWS